MTMGRYQNGPDIDYVNAWFRWKFLFVGVKVLSVGIGILIMVVGFVVTAINPTWVESYMDGVGIVFLIFCALVLCRWVYLIFRLISPKKVVREEWVPQGAIKNPPQPWFDDQGRWLWARDNQTGGWLPITDGSGTRELEWRDPPVRPTASAPPGNRGQRREPKFGK
jgi:hypothetical protein